MSAAWARVDFLIATGYENCGGVELVAGHGDQMHAHPPHRWPAIAGISSGSHRWQRAQSPRRPAAHSQVAVDGLRRMRYSAGLPVELSVAAILRAINPLLPMPVTTTRPLAGTPDDSSGPDKILRHRPVNAVGQLFAALPPQCALRWNQWISLGIIVAACGENSPLQQLANSN